MIPILSVIVPQLVAEVINKDIVLGPVTGTHAMIVEALLKQFLSYMKGILSLLLQDSDTSQGTIIGLEGIANSIRFFDAALADYLKLLIYILRIRPNLLIVLRADLKASVEQTT